jgi:hypothetical protein
VNDDYEQLYKELLMRQSKERAWQIWEEKRKSCIDCSLPVVARGMCQKHYTRWWKQQKKNKAMAKDLENVFHFRD